jgi:prophage regulatory protein
MIVDNKKDVNASDALLRLPQVLALFPVSRSAWYHGIAAGKYPQPIRLGPRTVAWRSSDIQILIERLATAGGESDGDRAG